MSVSEKSIKQSIEKAGSLAEEMDLIPKRSTPRERTVSRMRRLLLTTMGICISESCFQACILDPPPPPMIICSEDGASNQYYVIYENIDTEGIWAEGVLDVLASVSFTVFTSSSIFDLVEFSGDPEISGASLQNVNISGDNKTISIECLPSPGATKVEIMLPVSCGDYENVLEFSFYVPEAPAVGEPIYLNGLN